MLHQQESRNLVPFSRRHDVGAGRHLVVANTVAFYDARGLLSTTEACASAPATETPRILQGRGVKVRSDCNLTHEYATTRILHMVCGDVKELRRDREQKGREGTAPGLPTCSLTVTLAWSDAA